MWELDILTYISLTLLLISRCAGAVGRQEVLWTLFLPGPLAYSIMQGAKLCSHLDQMSAIEAFPYCVPDEFEIRNFCQSIAFLPYVCQVWHKAQSQLPGCSGGNSSFGTFHSGV